MAETRHLVAISVRGPDDASFTFIHPDERCRESGWEACEFKAPTPSPRRLSSLPTELGVYAVTMLAGTATFEFVRDLGPEDWYG